MLIQSDREGKRRVSFELTTRHLFGGTKENYEQLASEPDTSGLQVRLFAVAIIFSVTNYNYRSGLKRWITSDVWNVQIFHRWPWNSEVYCMTRVTLRWLSQPSYTFPVPAVVFEIHNVTPWRLSIQWRTEFSAKQSVSDDSRRSRKLAMLNVEVKLSLVLT
jgi:hypothetical protein